jgi:pimeloyl-ACP methyl ester carboxylesterase
MDKFVKEQNRFLKRYSSSEIPCRLELVDQDEPIWRYGVINDKPELPNLVFIHGAPGSIYDFKNYYKRPEISGVSRIIAIERPGYWNNGEIKAEPDLLRQAEAIALILQQEKTARMILIGHSYGGPISVLISARYPELINGLILLAPAIAPELEKMFIGAYLENISPLNRLIPFRFRIASREKLVHQQELFKIQSEWEKIRQPVVCFHGTSDWIVPFANLAYVEQRFTKAKLECFPIKFANHFINYFPRSAIVEAILRKLKV